MAHISFIHGISNKPAAAKLHRIWLEALAKEVTGHDGLDLSAKGITSSMVYWADVLYDQPLEGASIEEEALHEIGGEFERTEAVELLAGPDPDMSWRESLSGEEKAMVDTLAAKLNFDVLVNDTFTPAKPEMDPSLERIPLPWFIKRKIMKQFLRDVHHYLFNVRFSPRSGDTYQVQDVIRGRMLTALQEGATRPGPHVVVSHSMGTVIAYDCLMRVKECPRVDALMTIGSPLGLDEVQDNLIPAGVAGKRFPSANGFPKDKVAHTWVNVYDALDPVTGFDGNIANDFQLAGQSVITVIKEANWGSWRHNISKYFAGPALRKALEKQLGL